MIEISRIDNKKDIKECCMYVEKDYPHPYESLCCNCPGKDICEKSTSKMPQKEGYIAMRYCCKVENWNKYHKEV